MDEGGNGRAIRYGMCSREKIPTSVRHLGSSLLVLSAWKETKTFLPGVFCSRYARFCAPKVEKESSAEILFRIKRDLEGATSYRWMDGCEEESLLCRFREFLVSRFFVTKTLRRLGLVCRMTLGIFKHLSCLVVLRLKPRCGAVDFVSMSCARRVKSGSCSPSNPTIPCIMRGHRSKRRDS
jgi:hypothetical protein